MSENVESRARWIDPLAWEAEGPFTAVIRNDSMITCGPMRADLLHYISLGERMPEEAQEAARQIIRECDEDEVRMRNQVDAQVEIYRRAGFFDRDLKPWWRRLFR